MNINKIKSYAPAARRDFIRAVTDRANLLGLAEDVVEPVEIKGDIALIGGRPFPRQVADQRRKLEEKIRREGFESAIESIAYTWFNRFVALRYMEIHGYLEHGYRVLSNRNGKPMPEILEKAEHVAFSGLSREKVIELKLDGTKDAELYRLLLVAQCNSLLRAMPFLFEHINHETELLLPNNLLHSDSLIRKLVEAIDEEEWKEVEIIGWLYQYYIQERYEEVIGKVVKSEDIPAATQRFTPKWIVKYLVQNTIGRQWLDTYPNSPLREKMAYYVPPAEQSKDVQAQIASITPSDLDPETITVMDPACGSGHILVEAYDLLKEIYLERGYRTRDIPRLILEKNLFGLEICDRAAQLAGFALLMKARADDRKILALGSPARLNVMTIENSTGVNPTELNQLSMEIVHDLLGESVSASGLMLSAAQSEDQAELPVGKSNLITLLELFRDGKSLGSLTKIPDSMLKALPAIDALIRAGSTSDNSVLSALCSALAPLVRQTTLLAGTYDHVITNPPYMGRKYFESHLKSYIDGQYKQTRQDLYGSFILRNLSLCKDDGYVGMITIPNWMFLSSFEKLRDHLVEKCVIETLIHNGRGIWGSDFGSCAFVFKNTACLNYRGVFKRLFDKPGSVASLEELERRFFEAASYLVFRDIGNEFLVQAASCNKYFVIFNFKLPHPFNS